MCWNSRDWRKKKRKKKKIVWSQWPNNNHPLLFICIYYWSITDFSYWLFLVTILEIHLGHVLFSFYVFFLQHLDYYESLRCKEMLVVNLIVNYSLRYMTCLFWDQSFAAYIYEISLILLRKWLTCHLVQWWNLS
jgi:hypothetical protein